MILAYCLLRSTVHKGGPENLYFAMRQCKIGPAFPVFTSAARYANRRESRDRYAEIGKMYGYDIGLERKCFRHVLETDAISCVLALNKL